MIKTDSFYIVSVQVGYLEKLSTALRNCNRLKVFLLDQLTLPVRHVGSASFKTPRFRAIFVYPPSTLYCSFQSNFSSSLPTDKSSPLSWIQIYKWSTDPIIHREALGADILPQFPAYWHKTNVFIACFARQIYRDHLGWLEWKWVRVRLVSLWWMDVRLSATELPSFVGNVEKEPGSGAGVDG